MIWPYVLSSRLAGGETPTRAVKVKAVHVTRELLVVSIQGLTIFCASAVRLSFGPVFLSLPGTLVPFTVSLLADPLPKITLTRRPLMQSFWYHELENV